MNHQDIADRLKQLGTEKSAALAREEARIEAERQSLRELCGGIGHIYMGEKVFRYFLDPARPPDPPTRRCAVCGQAE